jgi:hypothetical protein
VGMAAATLIAFALFLGAYDRGGAEGLSSASRSHLLPLSMGALALLVGSLLPDLDGRGVVRWFVGPLTGAMALVPPLTGSFMRGSVSSGLRFLSGPGSRLFLFSCSFGYMVLLVPFKHRGRLHTHRAGLVFGLMWGVYLLAFTLFDPLCSFLAGAMGYLGYSWHLALDGKL